MEFNEKLQQLGKQNNMTQEELAEKLFVSRTAISKWESGRGFPSIDSLKTISKVLSVSIDELLSQEELMDLAENHIIQKTNSMYSLIFGIIDCLAILAMILPIFGVKHVSLFYYQDTTRWIWITSISCISLSFLFGFLQLILQNYKNRIWLKSKIIISLTITFFSTSFFIASQAPYASFFMLCLLTLKGIIVIKSNFNKA